MPRLIGARLGPSVRFQPRKAAAPISAGFAMVLESPKCRARRGTDVQPSTTLSPPINHLVGRLTEPQESVCLWSLLPEDWPVQGRGLWSGSCRMRKEKRVGKEFLLPWVRGMRVSSSAELPARGQTPPPPPPQITGAIPPGLGVGDRARQRLYGIILR